MQELEYKTCSTFSKTRDLGGSKVFFLFSLTESINTDTESINTDSVNSRGLETFKI